MALHQPRPFSFPASPPTSHGHMYDDTSSKSPPSSPGVTVRRKAFVLSSIATNASVVGGSPTHAPARKMPPPLLRSNTEVLFTSTLPVAKEAAPRPKRKTGLLDWIRVCRSGKDLTSVGGVKLTVTEEELAKHNTPEDAWTAIRGKYNFFRTRLRISLRIERSCAVYVPARIRILGGVRETGNLIVLSFRYP